mmetsp:Transcript_34574/g.83636  ORF Transcript_34574/g.83636 Transcript_34574/m.83636 type:complete len:94 (-) Transcript_34574:145-426(-)
MRGVQVEDSRDAPNLHRINWIENQSLEILPIESMPKHRGLQIHLPIDIMPKLQTLHKTRPLHPHRISDRAPEVIQSHHPRHDEDDIGPGWTSH